MTFMFNIQTMNQVNEMNNNFNYEGGEETESSEEVDQPNENTPLIVNTNGDSNFFFNTVAAPELRNVNQNKEGFCYLKENEVNRREQKMEQKRLEQDSHILELFNKSTMVDRAEQQMDMKLVNITFVIFTFFYLIVLTFGETTYILLITIVALLIYLLVSRVLLENTIFLSNDFHVGWNYYIHLMKNVVLQILLLVTFALIFEMVKSNTSIHPYDSVFFLVVYLMQWLTISYFMIILSRFIQQFSYVLYFIVDEYEVYE